MSTKLLTGSFLCLLAAATPAWAGSLHGGFHSHEHSGGGHHRGGLGGGWAYYTYPYYETIGPNGLPIVYMPPLYSVFPMTTVTLIGSSTAGWNGVGAAGPLPPRRMLPQIPAAATPKKSDPNRAAQLMTFGDRLFRAANLRKAEERFEQAARADTRSAAPHVRLAQVALVRGQFAEAAAHFRDAMAADPAWLVKATDIQALYAEPADFAKQVAKLESHLQAHPSDRDGWLVLGAQWFLSGRTEKAADIFLRLSDRKPDATLAAFLEATQPADRVR